MLPSTSGSLKIASLTCNVILEILGTLRNLRASHLAAWNSVGQPREPVSVAKDTEQRAKGIYFTRCVIFFPVHSACRQVCVSQSDLRPPNSMESRGRDTSRCWGVSNGAMSSGATRICFTHKGTCVVPYAEGGFPPLPVIC